MKLLRDERGQTLVVTGFAITCLLGMAGFAVDLGQMFHVKRELQTAADAGAIAGAMEVNYSDVTTAADNATAQNGFSTTTPGVTVTVNNPPLSGGYTTSASSVEVIVSENVPTYFMKVFGLSTMKVSARAVAGLGAASGCIYTLDTSGIDVGMTGSGALNMPDCGIVINSGSSDGLRRTGSSTISALSIGIVGGYDETGSGSVTPTPITGVAPEPNPLAWLTAPTFSASSCLASVKITGGTATLGPSTPGGTVCYNGISITGATSNVTFNPGTYIINGSFSQSGSGTITGSGVTFYMAPPNGSLSITGSGTQNLIAPTTGTYNGILFFEDPTDTNGMTITGSGSTTWEGIIYAPDASLSMTGSSGSTIYTDLVVSALSMTGTTSLSNYADINKNEPLTSPRLVE